MGFLLSAVSLAVELTVVGATDFIYLLVEQRNLIGFQARLQIAGDDALVELFTWSHDNKQLQGTPHNGMGSGNADAVGYAGHRHGSILHFGRGHLETAHIDDIVGAAGKVQSAFFVDDAAVGSEEGRLLGVGCWVLVITYI